MRGNVRALLDRPHGDVRAVHSASALRAMGAREKKCAVRFTATWCAPCARFAPKFTALAREFDDVAFATVDVDARAEDALEAFHIETESDQRALTSLGPALQKCRRVRPARPLTPVVLMGNLTCIDGDHPSGRSRDF